jgi:mannosyltransferase
MTSSGGRTVLSRATGPSPSGPDGYTGGPVWMRVLPSLVMLGIGLWGSTGPSYWRDEAATLTAVHRSFPQLVRMMGKVDAVHGVYYMIMWPVVRVAGSGELVTRLPSVLAMAVAAAAVAALGRRLVSPGAGLAAGLTFAVLPQVSRYAQDVRSYAMVAAFAAIASYLLVRAITTTGRKRGWLTGYALCMGAMSALNIFGLLLLAAHAVTVALACLRQPSGQIPDQPGGEPSGQIPDQPGGEPSGQPRGRASLSLAALRGDQGRAARSLAAGWLAAALAAVALASPILALGIAQRHTAGWIKRPGPHTVVTLGQLTGPVLMVAAVVLTVAAGLGVAALAGPDRLRAAWPRRLPAVAVPWLVIPPVLLIGVSFALPLYVPRYVLYCLPALALLVGAALAALGRIAGTAVLVAIALLGLSTQLAIRGPAGHGDNIRRADAIIAAHRHPGDAVIYVGHDAHYFTAAYPYGLPQLDNIAQRESPAQARNLSGTTLPAAAVRHRLAGIARIWVIGTSAHRTTPDLAGLPVRRLQAWRIGRIWLVLYQQRPA